MFTVYVIEALPNGQFTVYPVTNVVSGTFIPGGVALTLSNGGTATFTSRNQLTVTRAWDLLVATTA